MGFVLIMLSFRFERHWNCTVVMQSGQRNRVFVTVIVTLFYTISCMMHCSFFVINNAEVWHATRPNKPARFTSLQVVQIQVMEGRDRTPKA